MNSRIEQLCEVLRQATIHNDIDTLCSIFKNNNIDPNINISGYKHAYTSLLHLSLNLTNKLQLIAHAVIDLGIDIHRHENDVHAIGNNAIALAMRHASWSVATRLLEMGADVNSVFSLSFERISVPIIKYTIDYKTTDLLMLLLQRGVKVDEPIRFPKFNCCYTALGYAILSGKQEAVKKLLEHGACPITKQMNINAEFPGEISPYDLAVKLNHPEIVTLIAEATITWQAKALRSRNKKPVNDTSDVIQALFLAIKNQDIQRFFSLLNVLKQLKQQQHHFAALRIKPLYNITALLNSHNATGDTLLIAAIHAQSHQFMEALLDVGVNPLTPDNRGVSPLRHLLLVHAKRKQEADNNWFNKAASILFRYGADLKATDAALLQNAGLFKREVNPAEARLKLCSARSKL